ncbi:hypothetical protein WN982_29705 [Paraburkholderia sp. IMGN_8]
MLMSHVNVVAAYAHLMSRDPVRAAEQATVPAEIPAADRGMETAKSVPRT